MKEKFMLWKESLKDEVKMSKKEYLLVIAVCILGGIVFGLLSSPRKTTTIGSHNGNNNCGSLGSNNGNESEANGDTEEGACECACACDGECQS